LGGAPIEAGSASCLEPDRNLVKRCAGLADRVNRRPAQPVGLLRGV
jgi:hypothetical protein